MRMKVAASVSDDAGDQRHVLHEYGDRSSREISL